jgi:hypothetical protein
VTEMMARALAKRGRTWGERNAEVLRAIREMKPVWRWRGGPGSLAGRYGYAVDVARGTGERPRFAHGGYRVYAPPAQ